MTPETWRLVQEVFFEVADLPPDAQAAALDQACTGNRVPRQAVERLLLAERGADGRLDGPAVRPPQPDTLHVGQMLGRYRVVEEIGRGGLGTVYLGRREGEFEQDVAIKVIRRGLDTEEVVRRFEAERRILGRLVHPRIARILDAGTTEDGRPFFVMEHVDGPNLDDHAARLAISERLSLFLQICEAVRFAHQKLVIHRDLKPSNVLVTDEGAKLLDFGIAKVLDPDRAQAATAITLIGSSPMTLDYASPEQARGDVVTTATDVYSLGVMLYRLLTGRHPYQLDGCNFVQCLERICRTQPAPPRKLCPAVDRDLDSIVMRAIRKEPEARYTSVERLADDIQRYLDRRPVLAHNGNWSYFTAKFLRRYAWWVAFAAALLAAAIVSSVQWWRAETARGHAEQERQVAERVTDLLVDLFEAPEPDRAKGTSLTAGELLERGRQKAMAGLDKEPRVRARLLQAIGRVYRKLGAYAEARDILREALRVRRSDVGPRHLLVAESLHDLAFALRRLGEIAEARTLVEQAVEIQREHAVAEPLALARGLNNLGTLCFHDGDYAAAEAAFEESLAIKRRLGVEQSELLSTLNNLASTGRMLGRLERAVEIYREVLVIRRQLYGDLHTKVAGSMTALATALRDLERPDEAEALLRRALAIQQQLEGETHPRVGRAWQLLGTILQSGGDLQAASEYYERAEIIQARALGPAHPETLRTRTLQAAVLGLEQDYESCTRRARAVVEIMDRESLGDSWQKAAAESVLGSCLAGLGHGPEATRLLASSYRRLRQVLGEYAAPTRAALERLETVTRASPPA